MPDLTPYGDRFFTYSRMFAIYTQAGPECFIIKTQEIVAPEEEHRESRVKHIAEGDGKAHGPGFNVPNTCFGPVKLTDKFPNLTCIF